MKPPNIRCPECFHVQDRAGRWCGVCQYRFRHHSHVHWIGGGIGLFLLFAGSVYIDVPSLIPNSSTSDKKAAYRLLQKERFAPTKPPPARTPDPRPPSGLTFKGYDCTIDCSGHEAGYQWAEEKGISDPDDCGGNSRSFIEGCQAYAEENGFNDGFADDEDEVY